MEIRIDEIFHIGMLKKAVGEVAPEAHLYDIAASSGEGDNAIFEFCLLRAKKAAHFKVKSNHINDYSHLKDVVRKAFLRIASQRQHK